MKDLYFGKGFLELVLIGEKDVTIRKFDPARHTFEEGELFLEEYLLRVCRWFYELKSQPEDIF